MTQYDDLVNLPHHVSRTHPRMSLINRAAQFSPFAALVGYEAAIKETERTTEKRHELDAEEQKELNRRLFFLSENVNGHPNVCITHFVPDSRKSGGSYQTITGTVEQVSAPEQLIVLSPGKKIQMENIMAVTGVIFEKNKHTKEK